MITLSIMIKELSLAVFFGLLIGFGLTGTYFFIRPSSNQTKNPPSIVTPSSSPTQSANPTIEASSSNKSTNSVDLEVTSHQNYDLVANSKITLAGKATPQSQIIITTPSDNYSCFADTQGNFSQSIDLESGFNDISLTAITSTDQEKQSKLYITYSTAKIE